MSDSVLLDLLWFGCVQDFRSFVTLLADCGMAWAPSEIFVRGGQAQKAPIKTKNAPYIEKRIAERPPHGEKGPP